MKIQIITFILTLLIMNPGIVYADKNYNKYGHIESCVYDDYHKENKKCYIKQYTEMDYNDYKRIEKKYIKILKKSDKKIQEYQKTNNYKAMKLWQLEKHGHENCECEEGIKGLKDCYIKIYNSMSDLDFENYANTLKGMSPERHSKENKTNKYKAYLIWKSEKDNVDKYFKANVLWQMNINSGREMVTVIRKENDNKMYVLTSPNGFDIDKGIEINTVQNKIKRLDTNKIVDYNITEYKVNDIKSSIIKENGSSVFFNFWRVTGGTMGDNKILQIR